MNLRGIEQAPHVHEGAKGERHFLLTTPARGNGNKQIARSLSISERTVRNHVSNIYRKLHVYDRTRAVLYAIREGLVDVDGVGNN